MSFQFSEVQFSGEEALGDYGVTGRKSTSGV
jgi:hypothetical protein